MAEDTKYETVLALEEYENTELRPVAVQIKDVEQDNHEGQSGQEMSINKYTQNENEPEDQEQIVRDKDHGTENGKGDSDSSSDSSDSDSSSGSSDDSDSDDFWDWMFWRERDDEEKRTKQTRKEEERKQKLFKTIEEEEFPIVQGILTAKTIMSCGNNPLLVAIDATEKLHARVNKKEPDKAGFKDLANRVEEFTLRFMDPLKYDGDIREAFLWRNSGLKVIVENAIKLKQKKFFDHPIILELMAGMWYGDYLRSSRRLWLFLNLWCLFDMVLFPISFFAAFVLDLFLDKKRPLRSGLATKDNDFPDDYSDYSRDYFRDEPSHIYCTYKKYFKTPYFIFVRDTLSYLALLGLHLVICFEPSQLSFSGVEWAIVIFFFGRLLMEVNQVADKKQTQKYLSDRWNFFDIIMLINFFCVILPIRIATWAGSESVTSNRTLQIAECLYGLNTMLLVFRAFGSILETSKGVGTIQIALFHIIVDASVVVLHFAAITLAFSSTITKIFVSEVSFRKGNTTEEDSMCTKAGIHCWWKIFTHLGLSVLELSDGLDFFKSADSFSYVVSHVLFATYLVLALILLINMLIALLSNTYQRVEDNSRNEWAFQKAITIQTYRNYHPTPVPFNIVTIFTVVVLWLYKKCNGVVRNKATKGNETVPKNETDGIPLKREANEKDEHSQEKEFDERSLKNLLDKYRLKYGDTFPPIQKVDQVLDDTENTESMVNQLLYRTFTKQQNFDKAILPTGEKAWKTHPAMRVDGLYLTCQPLSAGYDPVTDDGYCARYCTPFSEEFPHFEVMIVETGETKWLSLGVVFEDYGTIDMPGWRQGTVGYHTDDRLIFDADYEPGEPGKTTTLTGCAAVRRGDVIRCTVLFEEKQHKDGKLQVPVVFYENGSKVIPEDKVTYITYEPSKLLYPSVGFDSANTVLVKMCPKEDTECQCSKIQEVKYGLLESKLAALEEKLDAVLLKLGENKDEE